MGGPKENPKNPNIPKSPKCQNPMISKSKRPETSKSQNPEHPRNKAHKSNNPEISKPQEFKILKIQKTQTRIILQCPESQNTKAQNPQIAELRKPQKTKIAKSQDIKMPRIPKPKTGGRGYVMSAVSEVVVASPYPTGARRRRKPSNNFCSLNAGRRWPLLAPIL